MKKNLIILSVLFSSITMGAQSHIMVSGDGFDEKVDVNAVDTIYDKGEVRFMNLRYPIKSLEKVKFTSSTPDLSAADKPTDSNKINRFYFTAASNKTNVVADIEGEIDGNNISVFLPYVIDFHSLKPSFATQGRVYVEGAEQKSGVSAQDFTNQLNYKVVAPSGEVRTYTVKVYNSNLPVVRVQAPDYGASYEDWLKNCNFSTEFAYESKSNLYGSTSVKRKGSRFVEPNKFNYSLKLKDKLPLLGMSNSKRWVLLSSVKDKSLLRAYAGYQLASHCDALSWTPTAKHVEYVLGDKHMGTYLFCEQIRSQEGRVAGAVWKITDDYDADDAIFKSSVSNLTFCAEDPEAEAGSEQYSSTQTLINSFEKALYGNNFKDASQGYRRYIDVNSFVDWCLVSEIAKSSKTSFKDNCYFTITSDNKIAMGPIADFSEAFGNDKESYEGYVTINAGWIKRMFEDPYFANLVATRFAELKSEVNSWVSEIEAEAEELSLSVISNEQIWKSLGVANGSKSSIQSAYQSQVKDLTSWINSRIEWLSVRMSNEQAVAKNENATSSNSISNFSVSKSKNSKALLGDFSATITNNKIDIFVPYLAHFDLVPEFTAAQGATVYVNGEKQTSGSSVVNFQKPVEYKVVSSSGDVRTYQVHIYNSGLPVIFINTDGNRGVNDKETWLLQTTEIYNADGTLDYMGKSNYIKGRGNSTWSASSDKRPYAVKLDKKERLLGMLEHKRWVLMANWYDATFFRNAFSNYLGRKFTNQQWVPSGYNVELVLNGSHKGNYYFCEQAKIHENRVDGEYLIEADIKEAGSGGMGGFGGWGGGWGGGGQTTVTDHIDGPKSNNAFYTKHPELEYNSAEFNNVKSIIEKFENALYGGNYSEVEKLIDLESFVDWYMIKEWSHDVDGNMHTSCYFTIMEDGKIKMGPMWDFDLAWGGNPLGDQYNKTEGYYITTNPISQSSKGTTTSWFKEFIQMPAFKALLKEKVNNLNAHIDEIIAYIDESTEKLVLSATVAQSRNGSGGGFGFGGFGGFGGGGGGSTVTADDYRKDVEKLKSFVRARISWFTKEVNSFR